MSPANGTPVWNNRAPNIPQQGGGLQPVVGNPTVPASTPANQGTPFGAIGVDANGNPDYGSGYKGFMRRVFSNIFNPDSILGKSGFTAASNAMTTAPDIQTQEGRFRIESASAEEWINQKLAWDKWGKALWGISAHDIGQSLASAEVIGRDYSDTGIQQSDKRVGANAIPAATGIAGRTITQAFWTGLGLMQVGGWANRNFMWAPEQTISDLGANTPEAQKVMHIAHQDMGLDKAPQWLQSVLDVPLRLYGSLAGLTIDAIFRGKLPPLAEFKDIFKRNQAAGAMIYSYAFDEAIRKEYQDRWAAGESPSAIKAEISNPIIEGLGDIFLDPMTYMGLELPAKQVAILNDVGEVVGTTAKVLGIGADAEKAKIAMQQLRGMANMMEEAKTPGLMGKYMNLMGGIKNAKLDIFGPWTMKAVIPALDDIIHIGLGKTRIIDEATAKGVIIPEIDAAYKTFAHDIGIMGADGAIDVEKLKTLGMADPALAGSVQKVVDSIKATLAKPEYAVTTLRSTDRAIQMGRDAGTMMSGIFHVSENPMDVINAAVKMVNGTDEQKAWAIIELMKDPAGKLIFSPSGMNTAIAMSEMTGEGTNLISRKSAWDAVQVEEAAGRLSAMDKSIIDKAAEFEKVYGNTPEKQAASMAALFTEKTKAAAERLNPSITDMKMSALGVAKKIAAGIEKDIHPADLRNAKMYEAIPGWLKTVNDVNEVIKKPYNKAMGFFTKVWLGMVPTAQPIRNMWGNLAPILLDDGPGVALQVMMESLAALPSSKITDAIVGGKIEQIKFLLNGQVGEGAARAIGIGLGEVEAAAIKRTSLLDKAFVGLQESQNVEAVAASNIFLHDVEKIIRDAVDNGLPTLSPLRNAQIPDELTNVLVAAARENAGNGARTYNTFLDKVKTGLLNNRDNVTISDRLRNFLSSNGLLDEWTKIRGAKNQGLFQTKFENFLKKIDDTMFQLAETDASLGRDIGIGDTVEEGIKATAVTLQGAIADGTYTASREQNQVFSRMVNTRQEMERVERLLHDQVVEQLAMVNERAGHPLPEISGLVAAPINKYKQDIAPLNAFRQKMVDMIHGVEKLTFSDVGSLPELWKNSQIGDLFVDGKQFTLASYFPDIKVETLSKEQFIDLGYRALAQISADAYSNSITNLLDSLYGPPVNGKMGIFREIAAKLGQNFDQMMAGLDEGGQRINLMKSLMQNRSDFEYYSGVWQAMKGIGGRVITPFDSIQLMASRIGIGVKADAHAGAIGANADKAIMNILNKHFGTTFTADTNGLRQFIAAYPDEAIFKAAEAFTGRAKPATTVQTGFDVLQANVTKLKSNQLSTLPAVELNPTLVADAKSVGVADIQGFKGINDVYGKEAGDSIIKSLGQRLKSLETPDFKILSRGVVGDGIVVVSKTEDEAKIAAFMQDLRENIRNTPFYFTDQNGKLKEVKGLDIWVGSGVSGDFKSAQSLADTTLSDLKKSIKNPMPRNVTFAPMSIDKGTASVISKRFKALVQDDDRMIVDLAKSHNISIAEARKQFGAQSILSRYGITHDEAVQLYKSIPKNGGDWIVPSWAKGVVMGELSDEATLLRSGISADLKVAGKANKQNLDAAANASSLNKILDKINGAEGVVGEAAKIGANASKSALVDIKALGAQGERGFMTIENTKVHVDQYQGVLRINHIEYLDPDGVKDANKALQSITQIADRYGADIKIFAQPVGTEALAQDKLEKWYSMFGFKSEGERSLGGTVMTRKASVGGPRGSAAGVQILDVAQEVGGKVRKTMGAKVMPYTIGSQPTSAQLLYHNRDGFVKEISGVADAIAKQWNDTTPVTALSVDQLSAVKKWTDTMQGRMNEIYPYAINHANMTRDFILHNYQKNYGDVAAGYTFMFPYWQSRTYMRFFERIVQDPKIAIDYLSFRNTVSDMQSTLPEWYRHNIPITFLPGSSVDNPLYFNLESSLNPINAITGVDFNDPYKRVDWLSKTVDDLGKFGPTVFAPLQWVVAAELYAKGEDDAARRWMGRLFPQSQTIKAGLTLAGADLNAGPFAKHNELDPIVNLLDGGLDPYEEKRVGRQLGTMVNSAFVGGQMVTQAMADDAARAKSGPIWEEAIKRAINERGPGQIASAFLGVGFKPRTAGDMMVDKFYTDYYKLLTMRQLMNADDYRAAWTQLGQTYKFMDTVLISKRAGFDRDTAYAYAVLGRVGPGQMTTALESLGITTDFINKFYSTKGDFASWSKPDYEQFMASVANLAAVLDVPPDTTKQEWDSARSTYTAMKKVVTDTYGADIYDKINLWYEEPTQALKDKYLVDFPQVSDAINMQNQYLMNTPLLAKYYSGIDAATRYYTSKAYQTLRDKFGAGIEVYWNTYYRKQVEDAANGTKTAYKFYKSHPKMKEYSDYKTKLLADVDRTLAKLSANFPSAPPPTLRPEAGQLTGIGQQNLMQALTPAQVPRWEQFQQILSAPMQRLIIDYFKNGKELPAVVSSQLDYMAGDNGFTDGKSMLRAIGLSLQNLTQ